MIPTQAHPGHYWKTNDPADLCFNEAGSDQPQTVRCYNMQDYLNKGEFRNVPVASLEYMVHGHFGEARGIQTRWSGDSHKYGIYRNPTGLCKNGIVVIECHGGGMVAYAFDNLVAAELWGHIAATFSPEMIWNICNQISHACRAARDAERNNIFQAFVDGRLKKRKRDKRVTVCIEPTPPVLSTSAPVAETSNALQEPSL